MPRRNEKLETGKLYCVTKPDGKYYRVYSKGVLDRLIEEGKITDEDRVGFIVSSEF